MTKIDTTNLEGLVEAAEGRAACKTGMAKTRRHFLVRLDPADATALGVKRGALRLTIGGESYWLTFDDASGAYREIAWEPAEPDAQDLGRAYARRNPIGAAMELLRIEIERHADHGA